MSVIGNPLLLSPEGYQISRSVRLRSSASAYFNRTPASAGNRKTWTWSKWVKRGALGTTQHLFNAWGGNSDALNTGMYFNTSDKLVISGYTVNWRITTQVFRDPSAWYHIMVVLDTTQATAGDRWKIYVNGVQVTAFDTSNAPTQNTDLAINQSAIGHRFGTTAYDGSGPFDGYLTEVNFIDGQALTPTSFGETDAVTGVWKPKKYAGTYGTNGFYLNFSDPSAATAAAIGKDYSGNGNNWTPNNISVTAGVTYDSMIDVPTPYADGGNGRGNYAVMNPISPTPFGSLTEGNQRWGGGGGWGGSKSTIGIPPSGKWYAELVVGFTTSNTQQIDFGIQPGNIANTYTLTKQYSFGLNNGFFLVINGSYSTNGGFAVSAGSVLQVAVDSTSGKIWLGVNNAWYDTYNTTNGNPSSDTNPSATGINFTADEFHFFVKTVNQFAHINFGQRPFAYTPPTGFKALNTQNLPEPTIVDGSQYFDATTYTGNGGTQSIVNSGGMQPDFVWVKNRGAATSHVLQDAVRGAGKSLFSNATAAESGNAGDLVASFNSNGFTVNDTYLGGSGGGGTNGSSGSYVGWQWKAGGTPAVTNTDGSITSTVSAGVTQGFSVVTYTGTGTAGTIGHGLGVAPRMIIAKSRSSGASGWPVYHASIGAANYLALNATAASAAGSVWNSTAPTSSVFSVGPAANGINDNGATYVAYCFAEVPGFSKFGSYTGNGSADGPFVFCGFRPRWVMFKRTNTTEQWAIYDTSRDSINTAELELFADSSSAEYDGNRFVDVLSNGFKLRSSSGANNASGSTYIYAAFAEHPFKNSLAR